MKQFIMILYKQEKRKLLHGHGSNFVSAMVHSKDFVAALGTSNVNDVILSIPMGVPEMVKVLQKA